MKLLRKKLPQQRVIEIVEEFTGIRFSEMIGISQVRNVSKARGLLCAALSRYNGMEFADLLMLVNRTENAVSCLIIGARKTKEWKDLTEILLKETRE